MKSDAAEFGEKSRFKGLQHIIGNTPLLEIHYRYKNQDRLIYAKAEYVNMTGSIKDRMAYHILRRAYGAGAIREGYTIAEATSGNTGISFSAIGRALGHPVVIFMPDWMSRERADLIRSMGARIVPISRDEGGFLGCIARAEALAKERGDVFLPSQFDNPSNVEAHEETTGPELWWQLSFLSTKPRAFVAGVGTGGTIMGVGRFLKKTGSVDQGPPARTVGISDAVDGPQNRETPHPGHLRRIHSRHRRPAVPGSGHRRE